MPDWILAQMLKIGFSSVDELVYYVLSTQHRHTLSEHLDLEHVSIRSVPKQCAHRAHPSISVTVDDAHDLEAPTPPYDIKPCLRVHL